MRIELIQVLTPIYSYTEVGKAEQRLADTKTELSKWQDEVQKLTGRRQRLRELAESTEVRPEVGMFLAQEADLVYSALSAAEAKVATAYRRSEELEAYLRRAAVAHEVLGWRK